MEQIELTRLDQKIIRLLQYHGRLPFARVARGLSVTEDTVRYCVKRLIDRGVLQIVGIVEPELLGLNVDTLHV